MPFGKRGSAVVFEGIAAVEMMVEVEVVVECGVDRGELLKGLDGIVRLNGLEARKGSP